MASLPGRRLLGPLCLPGEFGLQQPVHAIIPPSREGLSLRTCTHIFVSQDGHIPPLFALHRPVPFVTAFLETFQLQVGTKSGLVPWTDSKPCFSSAPVIRQQPPTRGRPPRLFQPQFFCHIVLMVGQGSSIHYTPRPLRSTVPSSPTPRRWNFRGAVTPLQVSTSTDHTAPCLFVHYQSCNTILCQSCLPLNTI